MPWWPDTVSMGIAFGVVAVLVVSKTRREREQNRRLWKAMKDLARKRYKDGHFERAQKLACSV